MVEIEKDFEVNYKEVFKDIKIIGKRYVNMVENMDVEILGIEDSLEGLELIAFLNVVIVERIS